MNDKLTEILETYLNGNISYAKSEIKKLSRLERFELFEMFVENNIGNVNPIAKLLIVGIFE